MKQAYFLFVLLMGFSLTAGLEGLYLTLDELEALKNNSLKSTASLHFNNKKKHTLSSKMLKQMREALFWFQCFPTTGLRLEKPFYPPPYPYIPHYFSLWQLAPHLGQDVSVALLDTGAAAFDIKGDDSYKKNYDLALKIPIADQNFNIVSQDGKNPVEQLSILIKQYSDPHSYNENLLKKYIPGWIKGYLKNNNVDPIRSYLLENGKKELKENSKTLSKKGEEALQAITKGPYGIVPGIPVKPFHLKQLSAPKDEAVIVELLPVARITNQPVTFTAGHGSHTLGLINAQFDGIDNLPNTDIGILGLAPEAHAFMIKAFEDNGESRKSTLIAAIKKALMHNAEIINFSLKVADDLDMTSKSTQLLKSMVDRVPYMVSSSGNNGDPHKPNYKGKIESYPARFASVPFGVGAFGYKNNIAYIAPFSQYEPGVGPLFVAPGVDILSAGLIPGQDFDSAYVFMSGTSMAASIMSGFVALMLGEFKQLFSREQLLKVCYTSSFKLHNNKEWQEKVILGVLDMRTALFILHAFNNFQQTISKRNLTFNIDLKFDQLIEAIRLILFSQPEEYGKKYLANSQFRTDFMGYFNKALKRGTAFNKNGYFIPEGKEALLKALEYITNSLLLALDQKAFGPKASPSVIQKIKKIMNTERFKLFENLPEHVQKRIAVKIAPISAKKGKNFQYAKH